MTHKNAQRDERILAHLGLYRVSVRLVLSSLFFEGRSPGNVLNRLRREGRVQCRRGLPNRLSYYQLTVAEAERRGLPRVRGRAPQPQALRTHLEVLGVCCAGTRAGRMRRLERAELHKLFGAAIPGGVHVVESVPEPRVLRVFAASPGISVRALAKRLRARIAKLRRDPRLGAWMRNGQYAFLVLTQSQRWAQRLRETIHGQAHRFHPARVEVEIGPADGSWRHGLGTQELGPNAPLRRDGVTG